PSRRVLLVDVLRQVRRERADLAILPGGFLTVAMESEVGNVLNPVLAEIQSIGCAVVIGVDVGEGRQVDVSSGEGGQNRKVQAVAVAWSPADGVVGGLTWRQRSITASHTKLLRELVARGRVARSTLTHVRSITVSGGRAGVLICGEMFNKDIRNAYKTDNKL